MNIAVIGGTGFENPPLDIHSELVNVETSCGTVTVSSLSDNYTEPRKLYFLSRHGNMHHLAPHQINYRANIEALLNLNVQYALATNAVGSLRREILSGSMIVPDDLIDFTHNRPLTYFENNQWRHVDFTNPYSEECRNAILLASKSLGYEVASRGVYLCTDGPRFETPAEIRLFASWGADVIGMTGSTEAVMAREAGIEYAALCIVTNPGAGLSPEPVSHDQVSAQMAAKMPVLQEILLHAARMLVK